MAWITYVDKKLQRPKHELAQIAKKGLSILGGKGLADKGLICTYIGPTISTLYQWNQM